jgi:hypothetical protein
LGLALVEFELLDPKAYILPVSSPIINGGPLAVTSISLRYDSVLLPLADDKPVVVGTGKRRFAERSSEDNIFPVEKKDGTSVATTRSVGAVHNYHSINRKGLPADLTI